MLNTDLVKAILPALCEAASITSKQPAGRETKRRRVLVSEALVSLRGEIQQDQHGRPSREAREAASELLSFVEDRIIAHDGGASDEGIDEGEYPSATHLSRKANLIYKNDVEQQNWLKENVLIGKVGPGVLDKMCKLLGSYHRVVSKASTRAEDDREQSEGRTVVTEWRSLAPVFRGLESLAQALKRHWVSRACTSSTCSVKHTESLMSPCFPASSGFEGLSCWLLYTNGDREWHASKLISESVARLAINQQPTTNLSGPREDCSAMEEDQNEWEQLCNLLEHEAGSISISCTSDDAHANAWTFEASGLQPDENASRAFPRLFATWNPRIRGTQHHKPRLILALRLVYAYLHLSGGPLWQEVEPNVLLVDDWPSTIDQPIFALQSGHDTSHRSRKIVQDINNVMPSLPALSKIIFEIVTNRETTWDTFRDDLHAFKDDEDVYFHRELYNAINSCLDEAFKNGSTIRDNNRLRSRFLSKVVLELQYVLERGFYVKVGDVFGRPLDGSPLSRKQGPISKRQSTSNLDQRTPWTDPSTAPILSPPDAAPGAQQDYHGNTVRDNARGVYGNVTVNVLP